MPALPPGFALPKPTEGCRKILREVKGIDDSPICLMANGGVCFWGESEDPEHRPSDMFRGRDVDKKTGNPLINLINEPAGGRSHYDRPTFPCPQRGFERDVGEGFVAGRH